MESLKKLKNAASELYAYIESARSFARQSLVVDTYFKLQGTQVKFFELKSAIEELIQELNIKKEKDNNDISQENNSINTVKADNTDAAK